MNRLLRLGLLLLVPVCVAAAADKPEKRGGRGKIPSFQELDANQDGKVSKEEFLLNLPGKDGGKGGKYGDKRDDAFEAFDKDADGFWNPEEYAAGVASFVSSRPEQGERRKRGKK